MCASGAVDEARDHGLELVVSVVAPREAGEVAFGVIGTGLSVGSGDRDLDVSERGVDPLEGGRAGCLAPGAGADGAMVASRSKMVRPGDRACASTNNATGRRSIAAPSWVIR